MPKIDWVEISAGEVLVGLSEQQIANIRARVRAEAGLYRLDERRRALVERVIKMFDWWRKGQLHLEYKVGEGWNLTPEENEIATDERFGRIIEVEASLQYEQSQQPVKLDTFYVARFPVVNDLANQFVAQYGSLSRLRRGLASAQAEPLNCPAEAWWQFADAFCHWVGGRLPTAAEWTKTARGTGDRLYPWGDEWNPARGNFIQSREAPGRPETSTAVTWKTPVDAYPTGVSPYEVWDMVGNVAEWTMTMEKIPNSTRQGPVAKGYPVKDSGPPYWFYNMVTWQRTRTFTAPPMYVGFRPVRDEWQRENWPGFCAANDVTETKEIPRSET